MLILREKIAWLFLGSGFLYLLFSLALFLSAAPLKTQFWGFPFTFVSINNSLRHSLALGGLGAYLLLYRRPWFDTALIWAGLAGLFFLLPHEAGGDGTFRYQALTRLIEEGKLPEIEYSLIGPLFSLPLYFLGKLSKAPEWWVFQFNTLFLALSIFLMNRLLKPQADPGLYKKFFLILVAASMFPNHCRFYYGEVFTAVTVALGIIALSSGRPLRGWAGIIIGVINIPASLAGFGLICLRQLFLKKQVRVILPLIIAAGLIATESWIRRGHPLLTGYEGNIGMQTLLPYSGKPGFSYPFLFGVLSLLLSFGKGILFFAPGLILLIRNSQEKLGGTFSEFYRLSFWFLVGLILVYAKWWSWYGGLFWGPRFFLFASIPASLALAVRLEQIGPTLRANLLTLSVLLLSLWVGVSGGVFDQSDLKEFASRDNYAWESLVWYVPEFSVLWRPLVVFPELEFWQAAFIVYGLMVFIYLSHPLLKALGQELRKKKRNVIDPYLSSKDWRF